MDNKYINISKKLKVLSDPKRLEIVDMLSCEELCACEILEKFDISQPTLSSDMKKLEDANIIKSRKEGKNVFYIVNKESLDELYNLLGKIFESSLDCICKK
ncbi:MAG: metalloregulator ArsR/SmtB family transcription factor [Anaerococcus vaginalis]|uniref:ArsR/SmtB family transcription factor n=1 Tax=Anaerococcus TaxID=165779 RepID=UPI0008A489E2|nr:MULTISPECIES: metalloregulator ArsR/SmtB family transcription factor [Anaerococcus]MDD7767017.1 metalloregulator ArsR/SmtB family transcription factor [Anaerococcus vaginalis]MDU2376018.1 metalloregulator ArsR/SmtB family transcription factor [Anaerococcus vaginalis]MDU2649142.1 metalloregulator ArsR/SmtB family transcription factor [Anaerococcus vaginalis]MDU4379304.1 metalloregulator ArsR/SmtB family transcription factor [Anaerococcus vaginalis]MDU5085806.1 metalloregulator ArsR/SmtB fami